MVSRDHHTQVKRSQKLSSGKGIRQMTTLCNPREAELLTVVVDTNVLIELFLPTQNGDVVQRLWDADRDWRLPVLSV